MCFIELLYGISLSFSPQTHPHSNTNLFGIKKKEKKRQHWPANKRHSGLLFSLIFPAEKKISLFPSLITLPGLF